MPRSGGARARTCAPLPGAGRKAGSVRRRFAAALPASIQGRGDPHAPRRDERRCHRPGTGRGPGRGAPYPQGERHPVRPANVLDRRGEVGRPRPPAGEGHLEWAGGAQHAQRLAGHALPGEVRQSSRGLLSEADRSGSSRPGQGGVRVPALHRPRTCRGRARTSASARAVPVPHGRHLARSRLPARLRPGYSWRFQPDGAPYCAECKREQRPVASSRSMTASQAVA